MIESASGVNSDPEKAFSHCRTYRDFIVTLDNLLYLKSEQQSHNMVSAS